MTDIQDALHRAGIALFQDGDVTGCDYSASLVEVATANVSGSFHQADITDMNTINPVKDTMDVQALHLVVKTLSAQKVISVAKKEQISVLKMLRVVLKTQRAVLKTQRAVKLNVTSLNVLK